MKTLFSKPKNQYLSNIISLSSPTAARVSVTKLVREFEGAATGAKRLRIARATQLAANRATVMLKQTNLSAKERKEFIAIFTIYKVAAVRMFREYGRSK